MIKPTVHITGIVTAYQRIDQTLATLAKLRACHPAPEEILVHVDGDQTQCAKAVELAFPQVKVILSEDNIGPGGARNKLITAAKHEIVASFDDDSFPMDADYFARLLQLFSAYSEAVIICGRLFHQGERMEPAQRRERWAADFSGGASAYRRERFLKTSGYVPLPTAYGMEEVDLALRLHAQGGRVLHSDWLRVFHDTDLERHTSPVVTAASLGNIALLAFLRYPVFYWPVGLGQIFNRMRWLLTHGRSAGIAAGLAYIPSHCWRHRRFRQVVPGPALSSYLQLRRQAVPVDLR